MELAPPDTNDIQHDEDDNGWRHKQNNEKSQGTVVEIHFSQRLILIWGKPKPFSGGHLTFTGRS
jgi:hypothetical protein